MHHIDVDEATGAVTPPITDIHHCQCHHNVHTVMIQLSLGERVGGWNFSLCQR